MSSFANWKYALVILVTLSTSYTSAMGANTSTAIPDTVDNVATTDNGMSVDDIEDVAFTLQRIRQEAIDMFVESTRKKHAPLNLSALALTALPTTSFADEKSYLPLRKGWLAYFIEKMEPLVHILNSQLKHLDEIAVKNDIPSSKMSEWHSLVKDWKTAIHGLNEQLDVCANLLDQPSAANVDVAKSAQAIDHQISVLDDILLKANKLKQEVVHQSN